MVKWRHRADTALQLRPPGQFGALPSTVTLNVLRDALVISSDLNLRHSMTTELLALNSSIVFLRCVARNQRQLIETFGQGVFAHKHRLSIVLARATIDLCGSDRMASETAAET